MDINDRVITPNLELGTVIDAYPFDGGSLLVSMDNGEYREYRYGRVAKIYA